MLFFMKYMCYSCEVVDVNLKCILAVFNMVGKGICFFFELFLNVIGNGFYLGVWVVFVNDEIVSWGII